MSSKKDGAGKFYYHRGGFTAVEVLVVIAILIALAAVAIPNLSGWASKQRLKGAARDLVTHFQYARLEAVKRSSPIAFTFNTNADTGPDGYRVFVDDGSGGGTPGNRVQDTGKNEITLIDVEMPVGVRLASTTFTDNEVGTNAFGYNARGFPADASFSGSTGVVTVADENRIYELIVTRTSGGLKLDGPK